MNDPATRQTPRWHRPLLILLGLPLFFYGLGSYSVVNGDEGYYHSVAASMVESGNWFHLDFYGQHRVYDTFMNAPLQYWARAVLISLFGDNLWTMRVLSATFGLLTVLAVYQLGARLDFSRSKRAALFAGLIQLTSYQFIYLHSARTGELDAIVAFLFTALALCFLRAVRDEKSFNPHHLLLAALITVKLPVALIPILAELVLFATTPSLRPRFKRYVASGFLIVPIGLLWHILQAGSLWSEFTAVMAQMSAEASGAKAASVHSGTALENLQYYARVLTFGLFPWSLAIIPALLLATKTTWKKALDEETLTLRVALLFAAWVLVFFAFVSKRYSWYVLPAVPFLAVCTGWGISKLGNRLRWTGGVVSALVLALAVWLSVPMSGLHPFADRTPRIPMHTVWRTVDGVRADTGALLLFTVLLGAFVLALRKWPDRAQRPIGNLVFGLLFLIASIRVVEPLADVKQVSKLDRIYRRVEAKRLAGETVDYPLILPDSMGFLRIKHYFGHDYRVESRRGSRGPEIHIIGERRRP